MDIGERELPQETGRQDALHFSKGCYIGQEIVERIRSRGNVHRIFTGFRVQGALPAAGDKVQLDGKDVGEITSAASVPAGASDVTLALGYIRREAATSAGELQIGSGIGKIESLPFAI